jgi:membrane protein
MAGGIKRRLGDFWELTKASVESFNQRKAGRLAAALAFDALLSMAPIAFLVIFVAGLLLGRSQVMNTVQEQMSSVFGPQSAELLENMVQNIHEAEGGLLSTIIGIGALIWGSSSLFVHLHEALNALWGVGPRPKGGLVRTVVLRAVSVLIVLGAGMLLFVIIALNTAFVALGAELEPVLPFSLLVMRIIQFIVYFGVLLLLIAIMYKFVPDVHIVWHDIWIGAAVTSFLFIVGQIGVAVYLSQVNFTDIWGAAGVVIVLLVWIFFSAQILFLGAQFTYEYANRHGLPIIAKYGNEEPERP